MDDLIKKLEKLEKLRAAELAAQQEAKEQTAQQLRNAQEAAFAGAGGNRAAQDRQRKIANKNITSSATIEVLYEGDWEELETQ